MNNICHSHFARCAKTAWTMSNGILTSQSQEERQRYADMAKTSYAVGTFNDPRVANVMIGLTKACWLRGYIDPPSPGGNAP